MTKAENPTDQQKAEIDAGIKFGMQVLKQIPRSEAMELHMTGVLMVFWGALWGTYGTEYARGFIESQLRSMETDATHERFVEPRVQ